MTDPVLFESTTPRFALPLLFAGQAQKEGFVNEIAARLDALVHCAIEGIATSPPASPVEGQCWLVGAEADAAWLGHDGEIAAWIGGNWLFLAPRDGLTLFDKNAGHIRRYAGTWLSATRPSAPAGGATVDAEARAAIVAIVQALENCGLIATT